MKPGTLRAVVVFLVLLAFFIVICVMSFAHYSDDLLGKGLPASLYIGFVLYQVPNVLVLGLPSAVAACNLAGLRQWRDGQGRLRKRWMSRQALLGLLVALLGFVLKAVILPEANVSFAAVCWDAVMTAPGDAVNSSDRTLFEGGPFTSTYAELGKTIDSMDVVLERRRSEILAKLRRDTSREEWDSIKADPKARLLGLNESTAQAAELEAAAKGIWTPRPTWGAFMDGSIEELTGRHERQQKLQDQRNSMLRYPWVLLACYFGSAAMAFVLHRGKQKPERAPG